MLQLITAAAHASGGGGSGRGQEAPALSGSAAGRGRSSSSRASDDREAPGVERRSYPPGEHGRGRTAQSQYRQQLREKEQPAATEVLEKQFRKALPQGLRRQEGRHRREPPAPARMLVRQRAVRLGFAASRRPGRQLIGHGHWLINGRRRRHPPLVRPTT